MEPTTVLAQARAALEATAKWTTDLLRSLPDLDAGIEGSNWSVGEAAIHLVNQAGIHTEIAAGLASPIEHATKEALAAENQARIGDIPERHPEKVADLLRDAVLGLLDTTAHRPADRTVRFHAGTPVSLAALVCISLGEHLLHGYDIAAAAGAPWPIDPRHAELALLGYRAGYGHQAAGGSRPSAHPAALLLVTSGRLTHWEAIALGLCDPDAPPQSLAFP